MRTSGNRNGMPDQTQSAQACSDSAENSVAASSTSGASTGMSIIPDEPTWRQMTVPVSTQAAMMGSQ